MPEAPNLIIVPESQNAFARTWQAKLLALQSAVEIRWQGGGDPELAPLRGAMVLAAGWPEFRRDLIRDLQTLERTHPDVIGREDWSGVVHIVWRKLKTRLKGWSLQKFGRPLTPRQVISLYERYFERRRNPTLAETKWTIEESDALTGIDGTRRGWASSGTVREGTLTEIASDLQDGPMRTQTLRMLDEAVDAEKRGER